MKNNNNTSKASQDSPITLTELFTGTDYKKGTDEDDNPRRPKHRYFAVMPETILYDNRLSDNAKLIYEVISRFTGDGKQARAGRKYIAEKLGKSERTVDRGLEELKEIGLAVRTERGNKGKGGRGVTYTKLKEPLHKEERKLKEFFIQPYPPESYQRNESVFDIEDGEVKARLEIPDPQPKGLHDKYVEQGLGLHDKYVEQPSGDKDSSQQGKDGENDPLSREVEEVYREGFTTVSKGGKGDNPFDTKEINKLKSKQTSDYNTPELVAMLQIYAIDADVVFEADKLDGDRRGKVFGQVEDLKTKLGGPAAVEKFYEWYFSDAKRVQTFKDVECHKKVGVMVIKLGDYNSARDLKEIELRIELAAPSTPYTSEDLQDLTLKELEELEEDKREPRGESEGNMAKVRAKMGAK